MSWKYKSNICLNHKCTSFYTKGITPTTYFNFVNNILKTLVRIHYNYIENSIQI